mmetsp:Transcript_21998/g.61182  ORF Transcript_21998/g.61182 Transcript_21998/m.61182 type:complete len:127 (-) Transcript_21998:2349-2729(-)
MKKRTTEVLNPRLDAKRNQVGSPHQSVDTTRNERMPSPWIAQEYGLECVEITCWQSIERSRISYETKEALRSKRGRNQSLLGLSRSFLATCCWFKMKDKSNYIVVGFRDSVKHISCCIVYMFRSIY